MAILEILKRSAPTQAVYASIQRDVFTQKSNKLWKVHEHLEALWPCGKFNSMLLQLCPEQCIFLSKLLDLLS